MVEGNAESGFPQQAIREQDERFDMATVLAISTAHGIHDLYNSLLAPLLPLLIAKLNIPLAGAGVLATVLRSGSLAQPFLGMWADRCDARYFVIGAQATTAIALSSIGVAPNYLTLVLLLMVGSLSSAAFHPAAAATITRASGRYWGRGASIYMTGAKCGLAVGPLFIVSLVTWFGLEMSFVAAIPGVLFSILLYLRLRKMDTPRVGKATKAGTWKDLKALRSKILLLALIVSLRATAMVSFSTFLAIYLTGKGATLLYAGMAMSTYELAGSVGAMIGGTVSDKVGRYMMLLLAQLVAGPLLYLALSTPQGPEGLAVLALAGAIATTASPVELTLFQELMPRSRSTAAGIWSLLSFEGALVATMVVGAIADQIGLDLALRFSVFAFMLAIPFTIMLKEPKRSIWKWISLRWNQDHRNR